LDREGDLGLSAETLNLIKFFNAAQFESSDAAKFIVLTTAVETLVRQVPRSNVAQHCIERFLEAIADTKRECGTSFDRDEIQRLANYVQSNVRNESISFAINKLLHEMGLGDHAKRVRQLYGQRGGIVHSGRTPALRDLAELNYIVRLIAEARLKQDGFKWG
jgi:hypothetical protein